ncbi:hypothetical protein [Enterobacter sp. RD4-1-1]|uniref:hypothetical protein n=1 Tax=Enterobacter sp. RD4-1-1 TaxID=2986135 RepID=UPI0021E84831|nr:hypothetical protein [Enterobacter sp. RD4-1-1]MCV3774226.1 hypothetical protein [Enterobacter sp. RD4-1-1]
MEQTPENIRTAERWQVPNKLRYQQGLNDAENDEDLYSFQTVILGQMIDNGI